MNEKFCEVNEVSLHLHCCVIIIIIIVVIAIVIIPLPGGTETCCTSVVDARRSNLIK